MVALGVLKNLSLDAVQVRQLQDIESGNQVSETQMNESWGVLREASRPANSCSRD